MDILSLDPTKFIALNTMAITFLFLVGLIGGLVSGFIGSGGAFVLTPGMMSWACPAPWPWPATCATSSPRPLSRASSATATARST